MDVTVKRENSSLRTTVYRKPTHTGRYLSFSSNHPTSTKHTVVNALVKRVNYISAGEGAVRAEHKRINVDLTKNGYPSKLSLTQRKEFKVSLLLNQTQHTRTRSRLSLQASRMFQV